MREVIVVGGGASGLMAALYAARGGASVRLLEHNEKLGRKLYITGKGRCNVTNDASRDEFLREVARNPRFLYSALAALDPQGMMALLEEAGCPVTVQRGRRVFPASEKASDVTRALERLLRQAGVEICLRTEVRGVLLRDGRACGVKTDRGEMRADAVILATGGWSYPGTGSTGDGYRMAAELGHRVEAPVPVLIGLETAEDWPRQLQGLSLRNVALTLRRGKKTLYAEQGEMLFTHFGVSGPLVLEASCHLPEDAREASLELNLKPGLTPEQLDARLQRDLAENPRRQLRSILPGLLPARLAELFPLLAGVDGSKPCAQVSRADRQRLAECLRALPVGIRGRAPLEEAIVTRGGVSVREIDPASMESRLIPGLYFAGELIDVDAHTGGYNLQIAFSTGALAGNSAAQEE